MATINVTKALIGKEDLSVGNSTFSRTTSTGGTATINKLNLTSFAEGWGTFTGADATPSVSGRRLWKTAGTTNITDFDSGADGQEIIVLAASAITIEHDAAKIALDGAANVSMAVGDTLTLALDSTVWYETSRTRQVPAVTSTTFNPGSLADGAGETSSGITVTGAALGDFVLVSAPYDLQDITVTGYVQAADTVEIRVQNESTGTVDLASGTWKIKVIPAA
jgi:hypothetical protein